MCCKTSWNNFNDPWHASEEIHTNLTCALVTGNIPKRMDLLQTAVTTYPTFMGIFPVTSAQVRFV